MPSTFPPSTWRHVGLGLAGGILALSAGAILLPSVAADSLGIALTPRSSSGSSSTTTSTTTRDDARAVLDTTMTLVGIRDLAAGGALLWFYAEGKQSEMGVVAAAWTFVCVADTWVAAQGPRGWDNGVCMLAGGTAVVGVVALGLLRA